MLNSYVKEDLVYILKKKLPWSEFFGKTVLISGAGGFIPSYIVDVLTLLGEKNKKSIKIICLVRNKKKALRRITESSNVKFVVQDVSKQIAVKGPVDYIIHAASPASPKLFVADPVATLNANSLGTSRMLELARVKKVKSFLYFSSGEVYGRQTDDHTLDEEKSFGYINPRDLRSCYAESKRMGETMCSAWNYQYKVPIKIVRLFHAYGPRMDLQDGRVFADFVADVVKKRDIQLKSDGKVSRSFCYIADAVAGILTVLLLGKIGDAYNVGNDKEEISIKDLAGLLVALYPDKKLKVVKKIRKASEKYVEGRITRNRPSTSKLRSLGWRPKYTLSQGFKRSIDSFN